ncbi:MAG: response regulator [Candidatus Sumerlaeota bacterium]|nr:response regulator [Candidatus Sumerlaeota bacterium]
MARTVVLIDDEADLVEMLTQALESKGFKVYGAYNGIHGLELVRRINPDVVICDLMMPGMSGLEVCRNLRGDPETKDIPILVISALGAESDKPEAFWAAGLKSDDFISKPFEPLELFGRLEYVLRKSQYVSTRSAEERQNGGAAGANRIDLEEAAPPDVVRAFIEAWNTQDFETEHKCMAETLTGGLTLGEYIARRRQVFAQEAGQERRQEFVKVLNQSRSADEAALRCERKDVVRGRERVFTEEYRLKKSPKGWKIVFVKREG